jgi:hypothetical protein
MLGFVAMKAISKSRRGAATSTSTRAYTPFVRAERRHCCRVCRYKEPICIDHFQLHFSKAIEIPMALQNAKEQESINDSQASNPHVQSKLFLSILLSQIFQFSLGLFRRLAHDPHIVVSARDLVSLHRQLIQHASGRFIDLVERRGGISKDISLVGRIKDGRLVAYRYRRHHRCGRSGLCRCRRSASFLIGIESVHSTNVGHWIGVVLRGGGTSSRSLHL